MNHHQESPPWPKIFGVRGQNFFWMKLMVIKEKVYEAGECLPVIFYYLHEHA